MVERPYAESLGRPRAREAARSHRRPSERSAQGELQRCRDERLGPVGGIRQVGPVEDFPTRHVQYQHRLGRPACGRVRIGAVVMDTQRGEVRQQIDEIEAAVLVTPADVGFGNVVTALLDPRLHAREVQLRAREAGVPDVDLEVCQGEGRYPAPGMRAILEDTLQNRSRIWYYVNIDSNNDAQFA